MNLLVFSDTHLGRKFDQRKYKFLEKLILGSDQVIINGDFWEDLELSYEEFISSSWQELFPILKEREAIFIPGNHDHISAGTEVPFATEVVDEYAISWKGKTLKFTHGQKFVDASEKLPTGIRKFLSKFSDFVESILSFFRSSRLNFVNRSLNKKLQRLSTKDLNTNEIMVLGHSHYPQFSPEKGYINIGTITFGLASYLVITDDSIKLYETRY